MSVRRKMTGWLLMLTLLLAVVFPNGAYAATGDVVAIDIDGSGTTVELTVGKTTKQLKVWGTVEGSSVKRDLTNAVTWTSSDSEVVKVSSGFLTPLKAGTVTIRADYESATSTIEVKAVNSYDGLTLEYSKNGKYKLGTGAKNLKVKALAAIGATDGETVDVTEDATWSSSNEGVLTIEKGQITLVAEGTATVTAKYSGLTATFTATVSSPYSELKLNYIVDDQTLSADEVELVVGDDDAVLKAFSTLASDQSSEDVTEDATWSSSDSNVATVEDGKIKALAVGKTTITAQYLGVRAQSVVYVRAPYEAILLNPSGDQSLFIGEVLEVGAKMRSSANASVDVGSTATWTSSNPLAVTVSGGAVTARAVGTSTITVSNLGISKTMKVTVSPTITELSVEETELEMYRDDTLKLPKVTGTKLDEEETDMSDLVKWSSDNEEIAKIEDGKIVALEKGTVTLTASLPESEVTEATAHDIREETVSVSLTVKENVLALLPDVERISAVVGEQTDLPQVTVVWEDGEEADITDTIEWTLTGSNAVIKTTSSGKVLKGLTKGSATLKGTYSEKTITVPVTVEQKITKVVVDPTSVELNLKKSKAIKVTGYYTDGKTVNLSSKMGWQSSNTEVATITTTSVKAVGIGTATLTGSYQGHDVSVKINVVPKLTKLTVDEKSLQLSPGYVKTVALTATYDTGATSAVTGSATWTSSKPSVATVTGGKIQAVAKGSATIKAVYGGKTVSIRVTVK
ncbi:Ig-like domain-containing protein [Paenibacillus sp. M1]|uniref:Ig-like domain-containing protein n=1 Tax=Paenibacillus haidiansis TaxID=1574488 RepID=A0ABU7VLH4_9BACL